MKEQRTHPEAFEVLRMAIPAAGLGLLVMLSGCTKQISVSIVDQALIPGPEVSQPMPPEPTLAEATRPEVPQQDEPRMMDVGAPPRLPEQDLTVTPVVPPPAPSSASSPSTLTPPEQPSTPSMPNESVMQPPSLVPAPPVKVARAMSLDNVYFDFDRFHLRSEARSSLEQYARQLKARNGWSLLIEGHCDERGNSEYNLVLGEKRARSVKRYLEDLGIASSQIKITSYGEQKPTCNEHNEDCWWKNRRAKFVFQ
jgi:peptidoglycan-associated lipoprotein